jgi:hypothetical protein
MEAPMRRSTVQTVALVFGVGFVLIALLGFFMNGGMRMEADMETAPRVLGLFPVNVLHNLVHLLFGLWGIAASRTFSAARSYCQASGVIYLALMVLGLIAPTTFGLIPIGGNDVGLHAVLGVALAAAGFTARPVHARI